MYFTNVDSMPFFDSENDKIQNLNEIQVAAENLCLIFSVYYWHDYKLERF